MVCKLDDGTQETVDEADSIRSIFREVFSTRWRPFEFAKAAWLHYSEMKMNYFCVPSLDAQYALLKRDSSTAASFDDEGRAPPTASAVVDDADEDDDRDQNDTVRLDNVVRVGGKRHLHNSLEIYRAKKRRVQWTVA